jgi:hypothetical protein
MQMLARGWPFSVNTGKWRGHTEFVYGCGTVANPILWFGEPFPQVFHQERGPEQKYDYRPHATHPEDKDAQSATKGSASWHILAITWASNGYVMYGD